MARPTSKLPHLLGRFVKGVVSVLLIPPVVGLALGISQQLGSLFVEARSSSQWFAWGMVSYVGCHLLLYKPKPLFRFNHALLGRLAVWLFGGQIVTSGAEGAVTSKSPTKGKGRPASVQGSTLVVLSPYLVPIYVVLLSALAWLVGRWAPSGWFTGIALVLVGASLMFHITMTADDLQQHGQFPIETYLMALAISSLTSLLVVSLCLPLALPGFSLPGLFAEATATTRAIYTSVFQVLF